MSITISIAYASKTQQYHQVYTIPDASTIQYAIEQSDIYTRFPEILQINLAESVGIFGQKMSLSTVLKSGDRIEIYRPLIIDPMTKRRLLANKK